MVVAEALSVPYQVRFAAAQNSGLADTVKDGTGGSAGMRPHELLEAALATCMTITARMALSELGLADSQVTVVVSCEREATATRFRWDLRLNPAADESRRQVVTERIERSPVRETLSKALSFETSWTAS